MATSSRVSVFHEKWVLWRLLQRKEEEKEKDVWTLILEEQRRVHVQEYTTGKSEGGRQAYTVVVGEKQSGKSSLVVQFLNPKKEGTPSATVALEYTFGRRVNVSTSTKDIAHLWELGGGLAMKELMDIPLIPSRLPTAVAVIVVDLSNPGDIFNGLLPWLDLISTRVKACAADVKPPKLERMQARIAKCYPEEHPDKSLVEPSLIPLVIVGSKYDVFQHEEGPKRKTVLCALRFVAHHFGASFVTVSVQERPLLSQYRALLNHVVFDAPLKSLHRADCSKPVFILAGKDSYSAIGLPHGTTAGVYDSSASFRARIELWKQAVGVYYKPSAVVDHTSLETEVEDPSQAWAEPAIDALRSQKQYVMVGVSQADSARDELERYRRDVAKREQRLRDAADSRSRRRK